MPSSTELMSLGLAVTRNKEVAEETDILMRTDISDYLALHQIEMVFNTESHICFKSLRQKVCGDEPFLDYFPV